MNLRLLFFIVSCFSIHSVTAAAASDIYAQAASAYEAGNFKRTIELLRPVEQKSYAMLLLMGDAAYKNNERGLALAHLRAAQRIVPITAAWGLYKKIAAIVQLLYKHYKLTEPQLIAASVRDAMRALPIGLVQIIFLVAWAFLAVYVRYLHRKQRTKTLVALVALVLLVGIILVSKNSLHRKLYGVVTVENAKLYSGPGRTYHELADLKEAVEVKIIKTSGDFYKVRSMGFVGWIDKGTLLVSTELNA